MGSQADRPGVGSALGRALLLVPAVFLLLGLPENVASWDSPNASVLPTERTMPVWGNQVLAVVTAVTILMLVAGWVLRRRSPRLRGWAAAWARWCSVVAVAGQILWCAALVASFWVAMRPETDGAVIGTVLPDGGIDATFAVIALATAALLIQDAVALSGDHRTSRAPLTSRAHTG
ncbi:hypothetical protein [Demequina muriae]|uniref:DUF2975 domain-containing protein n=1 Tax=Demequina muriae TaxID=3051664 RepID=A0ABT8GJ03_9MICO|nr:hypothetical protein [Demequina sp. EGI L300058]MDN4481236.1 hypothetical protein [Demequina sp. EGI L300058]